MPYPVKYSINQAAKTLDAIRDAVYTNVAALDVSAWTTREPVPFAKRKTGKNIELKIGQKWGDLFDCAWFRFTGKVPLSAKGKKVVCVLDVSGEMLVVDKKGEPVCGLTSMSRWVGCRPKKMYEIARKAKGNERLDIWADAGCNDLSGSLMNNGTLADAHIAICNEQMRLLSYDFEVLLDLMKQLPANSTRSQRIAKALADAIALMRRYTESEAVAARAVLAPQLDLKGTPLMTVSAVGHSHIDLAWLWPIRETIRKGARTFSTALMMMDRYPDYVFGASQPQLYKWIKDYYPQLYKRVRQRIKEGRWEVQGCMWVEADTNVTGGESLVRQVLLGKRFFRSEFGIEIDSLWLPDVFGYTGSLPQILKKSCNKYFMTQKISWNDTTEFPHHTFFWQGIDGSKVLSHLPPEDTYNSHASPESIAKIEREYIDKAVSENALLLFGIGDGGGGPGEEHLERLARQRNLYGLPAVVQEPSYKFFKKLEKNAADYKTWTGELYLEFHRGCYTTQSRNKRYNRKMEVALRELEFLASLNLILGIAAYPIKELESIWQEVLLYQFHDILPGSSINRVYDESLARYAILYKQVEALIERHRDAFVRSVDCSSFKKPTVVLNSLNWQRTGWVKLNKTWAKVTVPAMGYAVVDASQSQPQAGKLIASRNRLENDLLRVDFGQNGEITGILDKPNDRQVLSADTRNNVLAVYEDVGDAWDFRYNYNAILAESMKLQSCEFFVDGPRAVLRQRRKYQDCELIQDIVLTQGSRRLDFATKVDWRQPHKMLRSSFATTVWTQEAQCGIQFGSVPRPTHQNTPADMAKYEICAHRWVDLSDKAYGVAIMSDCKYGYKVDRNVLDINLLRTPTYPDPSADIGLHEFTYSLYPHTGDHAEGNVIHEAYELDCPLSIVKASAKDGHLPVAQSFITIDRPEVVIEAVKKCEDDNALIVRLYESTGSSLDAVITFASKPAALQLVDMMEENPHRLFLKGSQAKLRFGPFEIHTLKVVY